ncbi:hypothetical protein [Stenotrophomonas sp. PD6]|uniref:hypothetical protein n=1 Tax=Stenotrophomonas sp. PD6 TaxID=3368612 RepID=UPI003B9DCF7B
MAYLDLSPKRLSFLLAQGTHEGELKKFFTECKTQLLLRGAKVQNIPHGREERIRAICERLSRRTDDTLQAWFSQNINLAVREELDDVLLYLEAHFSGTDELSRAQARDICRSALTYIFEAEPNVALLGLLKGQESKAETQSELVAGDSRSRELVDVAGETDGAAYQHTAVLASEAYPLSELIASLIAGDEKGLEVALSQFSQKTRSLTTALIALRGGDIATAESQLPSIGTSGPEWEVFENALSRARHQPEGAPRQAGARVNVPAFMTNLVIEDTQEIIGVLTNESETGAVFVQPVLLFFEGSPVQLAKDHCLQLFPESGSVMTHRSALRRSPRVRDLVRWGVTERDRPDGRTRFHMDSEKASPIRVVQLPVPSRDPDEVRAQIRAYAAATGWGMGEQCIFLLLDGLAVISPKNVDVTRDEPFHSPWQVWTSLDTWIIEGHQYCLELPLETPSLLDLSPIGIAFSRLLKGLDAHGRFATSKAQRKELVELLERDEGREISGRIRRIAGSVRQMSIDEEQVELLLDLLRSHDDVKRRIEELVSQGVEARQREKIGLSEEIIALRRKKSELETEGRDIERRNRARAESVGVSVKGAFDAAIEQGAASLASAEIMRMLGGRSGSSRGQELGEVPRKEVRSWVVSESLTPESLRERLHVIGINARQVAVLSALVAIAERAGAAVLIKGCVARQCVQAVAVSDRVPVNFIDIPMGLTSSSVIQPLLDRFGESERMAFLGADLSPLDVYATGLLDRVMAQCVRERERWLIIGACVGGELSLPVPASWRKVALVINLDSNWDGECPGLDEVDDESIMLLRVIRDRLAEELFAVDERLRHHLEFAVVRAIIGGASLA